MLAAEVERPDVRIRGLSPQRVHTSRGSRSVEPVGHCVEVVTEQAGVHIERHRCGRVPEHPLDGLYVGSRLHRQARRRVPQVVRCQSGRRG